MNEVEALLSVARYQQERLREEEAEQFKYERRGNYISDLCGNSIEVIQDLIMFIERETGLDNS